MIEYRTIIIVIAVAILLPLAGCSQTSQGPVINYEGSIGVNNGTFYMNATLIEAGTQPEPPEIDDIRVYLYSADKTLLSTHPMGSFENATVSIQSGKIPEYVIIYSPDFETYDHIEFFYHQRSAAQNVDFNIYVIGSSSELPIVPETD